MPTPFEISDSLAKSQLGAFEFFADQVGKGMAAKSRAIEYEANVANQISQSAADYLQTEQNAWKLDQQNQREIEKLQLEKKRLEAYQDDDKERRLDKDRQLRLGERQKGITALGLNLDRQQAPLVAELGKLAAERKIAAERTPSGMAAATFEGSSGLEDFDSREEALTSKINKIRSQQEGLSQLTALIAAGIEPDDDMMQGFGAIPLVQSSPDTSEPEQVRLREAERMNANPLTPPADSPYNPSLFPTVPDRETGQLVEKPVDPPLSFQNEDPNATVAPAPPTPEQKVKSSVDPLVSSVADIINADPKKAPEALRHIAIARSYFKERGLSSQFEASLQEKRKDVSEQFKSLTMEDVILNVADPLSDGANMPITKYEPSESVKVLRAAALATEMSPVELDRMKNLLFAKGRSFIAKEKKANPDFDFYEDYEGNMEKFRNFVNPPAAKEKEPEAPIKTRSFEGSYMPAKTIKREAPVYERKEGDNRITVANNVSRAEEKSWEDVYKKRRQNAASALKELGYADDHPYVNKALYDGMKGEGLDKLVEKARVEKGGKPREEVAKNNPLSALGPIPTVEKFAASEDKAKIALKVAERYRDIKTKENADLAGKVPQSAMDYITPQIPMRSTYDPEESIKELETILAANPNPSTSELWEFIKKYNL